MSRALALPIALSFAACGPPTHGWLPAGSAVPDAEDDPAIESMIDGADGVERDVLRVFAFAEGTPAVYWHFGTVRDGSTMAVYRLCERVNPVYCRPLPQHPYVAEHLPGEAGHSHYGRVHDVAVTDRWDGEIFPSRQAIEDGVRDGLLAGVTRTDRAIEIPIVHREVRVEVGDAEWAVPVPIYVRGMEAHAIDLAATHGDLDLADPAIGTVLVRNIYVLTRDGEAMPLNEIERMADITGDGDARDTNNVAGVAFTNDDYTPLWNVVRVTVPSGYRSIDTAMDQTMADYRAATDMFTIDAVTYEITPMAGRVVSHDEPGVLVDCPLQSAPGAL
jgi:hypothetical protein